MSKHKLSDLANSYNYMSYVLSSLAVELAWRSGCVMNCHVAARGSFPGGNGVKTDLHVLRKGQ